jgi:uncharacterized protein
MLLALDRAAGASVRRRYDADGRLHVYKAKLTRTSVNPYKGSEIPNWKSLGLDRDRVYQMLRDPKELRNAAASFSALPLMSEHVQVSSEGHPPGLIIGALAMDAAFVDPDLFCSIAVWNRDAIEAIESNELRQLSCGYAYKADMTPGIFRGRRYSGVMRGIVGDHVALVDSGRAGSDCTL